MVKSTFKFHSVGQGLFYSGVISNENNDFVFVYDCGSRSKKNLNIQIDKFKTLLNKQNKNNIDLLIISHFHYDHIIGIPYLLKNNTIKINTVILQDLPEIQKLENYLYYRKYNKNKNSELYENEKSELSRLILQPVGYFLEKGAEKIVLVSSNEENGDHRYINSEQEINEYVNETNESHVIIINNNDIIRKDKNVIHTKNNIKCKNKLWEFCISCDKQINTKIHNVIENYLKKNNCEIKDVVSDEIKIKELISVLDEYKPKLKFNESSMILVHHPICNNSFCTMCLHLNCKSTHKCKDDNCIDCTYFNRNLRCYFNCFNYNRYWESKSLSTILTGDVVLNNTVCSVIKQFVNYNVPVIFQVPHHGSKSNSGNSINFVNSYSEVCSIIPCGYMYHHPSQYIYNSLNNPYIVDMHHSYVYMIDCF